VPSAFDFLDQLAAGAFLPPPRSAFGGRGLPHCQLVENLKAFDDGRQKAQAPQIFFGGKAVE